MTIDQIGAALSLGNGEKPILESIIDKMVYMEELAWVDDCLVITNWRAKQDVYPSDLSPKNETDDADLIPSELTPDELPIPSELTPDELPLDDRRKMKNDRNPPKGARKERAISDPTVAEIFNEMKIYLGYPEKTDKDPIPNYGREGQAIKRMLTRGFSAEEILWCWKAKVVSAGEFVNMTCVNEDIGTKRGSSSSRSRQRRRPRVPASYTPDDEF